MISKKLTVFFTGMMQFAAVVLLPGLLYAADAVQGSAGKDQSPWPYLSAALAVGLGCIASGYAVARIGSAGIGAVAEKPELAGKTLVFIGLAEGIAIYGLIIAVMILNKF
jgi:V/A-type H+-transporting ATPase subunit K